MSHRFQCFFNFEPAGNSFFAVIPEEWQQRYRRLNSMFSMGCRVIHDSKQKTLWVAEVATCGKDSFGRLLLNRFSLVGRQERFCFVLALQGT
jgi:hypothetical protein